MNQATFAHKGGLRRIDRKGRKHQPVQRMAEAPDFLSLGTAAPEYRIVALAVPEAKLATVKDAFSRVAGFASAYGTVSGRERKSDVCAVTYGGRVQAARMAANIADLCRDQGVRIVLVADGNEREVQPPVRLHCGTCRKELRARTVAGQRVAVCDEYLNGDLQHTSIPFATTGRRAGLPMPDEPSVQPMTDHIIDTAVECYRGGEDYDGVVGKILNLFRIDIEDAKLLAVAAATLLGLDVYVEEEEEMSFARRRALRKTAGGVAVVEYGDDVVVLYEKDYAGVGKGVRAFVHTGDLSKEQITNLASLYGMEDHSQMLVKFFDDKDVEKAVGLMAEVATELGVGVPTIIDQQLISALASGDEEYLKSLGYEAGWDEEEHVARRRRAIDVSDAKWEELVEEAIDWEKSRGHGDISIDTFADTFKLSGEDANEIMNAAIRFNHSDETLVTISRMRHAAYPSPIYGPEETAQDDEVEYHCRLTGYYCHGDPPTDLNGHLTPELLSRIDKAELRTWENESYWSAWEAWNSLSESGRLDLLNQLAGTALDFLTKGAELLSTLEWNTVDAVIRRTLGAGPGEEATNTVLKPLLQNAPTSSQACSLYIRLRGTLALAAFLGMLESTQGWSYCDVQDSFGYVSSWYAQSGCNSGCGVPYNCCGKLAKAYPSMLPRLHFAGRSLTSSVGDAYYDVAKQLFLDGKNVDEVTNELVKTYKVPLDEAQSVVYRLEDDPDLQDFGHEASRRTAASADKQMAFEAAKSLLLDGWDLGSVSYYLYTSLGITSGEVLEVVNMLRDDVELKDLPELKAGGSVTSRRRVSSRRADEQSTSTSPVTMTDGYWAQLVDAVDDGNDQTKISLLDGVWAERQADDDPKEKTSWALYRRGRRAAKEVRPGTYYECGSCGEYHREDYSGDCRSDADRFDYNDLEDENGNELPGIKIVTLEEQMEDEGKDVRRTSLRRRAFEGRSPFNPVLIPEEEDTRALVERALQGDQEAGWELTRDNGLGGMLYFISVGDQEKLQTTRGVYPPLQKLLAAYDRDYQEEMDSNEVYDDVMGKRRRSMLKHAPKENIADEATWEKAKKEVKKEDYPEEDSYWAVVTTVYRNMGGKFKGGK